MIAGIHKSFFSSVRCFGVSGFRLFSKGIDEFNMFLKTSLSVFVLEVWLCCSRIDRSFASWMRCAWIAKSMAKAQRQICVLDCYCFSFLVDQIHDHSTLRTIVLLNYSALHGIELCEVRETFGCVCWSSAESIYPSGFRTIDPYWSHSHCACSADVEGITANQNDVLRAIGLPNGLKEVLVGFARWFVSSNVIDTQYFIIRKYNL